MNTEIATIFTPYFRNHRFSLTDGHDSIASWMVMMRRRRRRGMTKEEKMVVMVGMMTGKVGQSVK